MVMIRTLYFFEADNLREEVERHGETISDRAYKDALIRVIPNSYIDMRFTVHRDPFFFPRTDSIDDA